MNPVKLPRHPTTRRTTGTLLAPLSKWCKKAIPHWMKRSNSEPSKADNDWSFKDKTLPWNDEVSADVVWDERAMLDIVMGEASIAPGVGPFRGALPEWNEADIVDSAWFEDASFYSDEASLYAHDDTSRYPDDDERDANDALEEYLNDIFNDVNRSAVDDASRYTDDDDDSPYFNDYSSVEIDYDAYPRVMDTDDDDSMADAIGAYLDLYF